MENVLKVLTLISVMAMGGALPPGLLTGCILPVAGAGFLVLLNRAANENAVRLLSAFRANKVD